ncbi:hypothetical protein [Extensimonas sp. H3M7-6]|uniref:hypothetical protein n=1 Tax=Extensimonas soli TaxID=3031322 RepID=UPI0023DAE234|nr:hypothetical protein [Extensimonas sp. H3M7-6]MDF1480516.1 hypothetical protein [Extensimonas sp. H3M7-6]
MALIPLWHDEGLWIALGVTLVSIVAALVMRHVFIKILTKPAPDQRKELSDNE